MTRLQAIIRGARARRHVPAQVDLLLETRRTQVACSPAHTPRACIRVRSCVLEYIYMHACMPVGVSGMLAHVARCSLVAANRTQRTRWMSMQAALTIQAAYFRQYIAVVFGHKAVPMQRNLSVPSSPRSPPGLFPS